MAKRRTRFHILKRRFFRLLAAAFVLMVMILIINTIQFSSRQVSIDPKPRISFPDSIYNRLSAAIQIPTVSRADATDSLPFFQLDSLLRTSFPLLEQNLIHERIGLLNHLYTWPGAKNKLPPILLTAHLDVVPVDTQTIDEWKYPPFSGAIDDNYIWGRGALDDKMSALGILEAIEALLVEGYYPERTVLIAFGHDEEVKGVNGAGKLVQVLKNRDIQPEFVLDEGYLILENALPGLSKPLAMIGVSEKGYATVKLRAKVTEGGHSSMPDAYSPIVALSSALQKLEEEPFPAYLGDPVASFFDYVGPEMSLPNRVVFANRWLTKKILIRQFSKEATSNALIRTTIAPTIIKAGLQDNVMPTEAELTLNLRLSPEQTVSSALNRIRHVIDDPNISVELDEAIPAANPSPVSSTAEFGFQVIQKTILEVFPETVVAPSLTIAQSDARYYQEICPQVYRFSPIQLTREDIKGIHGINERIRLEDYEKLVWFYRELIINSCR